MSELEQTKSFLIQNVLRLCAHCSSGDFPHSCPVQMISEQIKQIKGVPLLVNDEFKGVLFSRHVC